MAKDRLANNRSPRWASRVIVPPSDLDGWDPGPRWVDPTVGGGFSA